MCHEAHGVHNQDVGCNRLKVDADSFTGYVCGIVVRYELFLHAAL